MSAVGLFLSVFKGPTACYLRYPHSRFWPLFLVSFFDAFLEPNGPSQGPQNRSKSRKIVFQRPPWEHPPKSHQKLCNLERPNLWICWHLHTFSCFSSGPRPPKRSPKASQNGAFGHPKSQKKQKNKHSKNTPKNGCKNYQKRSQKGLPLSRRRGLQNHKNPSLGLKMCPKPPGGVPRHPKYPKIIKKRAPRASKIAQHHENLITQNQENPRKKIQEKRCGTVAGYARSALDTSLLYLILVLM